MLIANRLAFRGLLLTPHPWILLFHSQIYLDREEYKTAEKYFRRGLRIFRVRMEHDHPDVAMCVYKLGVIRERLLDDEGKYLEEIFAL